MVQSGSLWRWITGRGTAVLLLLLLYAFSLTSVSQKSLTVDEQGHLFRGTAYVKTGATHFLWGHPLLASSLNALPLLTEPDLQLPTDSAAWQAGEWEIASDHFLWQLNENPLRLIFLGRLPTLWLALLLGALLYRWGRELAGKTAAFLALALFAFDPNFLAHGGLISSDVAVTFFMLLAVYGFWRWTVIRYPLSVVRNPNTPYALHPTPYAILLTGLGLGGAAATKFSAAALGPILGLLALGMVIKQRSWRPIWFLVGAGGVAALLVWAVYGFQLRPFPAAAYWADIAWQLDYFSRPHGAYLFGRFAETGWWYYFPVTFLLKTPLPTLLLLGYSLARSAYGVVRNRRVGFSLWVLVGATAVYFLISLFTPLNIGYRHLLPILPFLFLFIAFTLTRSPLHPLTRSPLHLLLPLWLFLIALLAWPNYIPYFNWAAGRPENRWQLLSDSNLDWGQDLPALAEWQREHDVPLYLSYFGTAHPSAYGLDFTALPTWEPGPEQIPPFRQAFNPRDPAPGFYAISVTNLQGLVLGEAHDTFAWFRDKEPVARIGGSIFVYEVAARGEPVDVAFSGLRPAELAPELHARLGTNDVRVRWYDARTSFIWPARVGWWVNAADQSVDQFLLPFADLAVVFTAADGRQQLAQPVYPPPIPWAQVVPMGETAVFLGYDDVRNGQPASEINLVTGWQVTQATERPLKIFVHALDETGQLVGQWDGLDVDPTAWQPGDVFVQLHRFTVPETAVVNSFAIGLYDGATLERLAEPIVVERGIGE
ncbi:MAG: phospholipid carrier-dependent glycosyltransferase [Anaerolineaceae bacterium]|nr:phospholipid carrier-dependent glycosyltransferase [Anaerolineaceae bacterium]